MRRLAPFRRLLLASAIRPFVLVTFDFGRTFTGSGHSSFQA